MKKCIKLLSIMLTAAAVLAACSPKGPEQKPGDKTDTASSDPTPSGTLPKVTITSEATFDAENTATLTIKLSAASSKDVKVKLAKADVQAGKNEVPADFAKNVTIKAGELSAEVYAEADVLGLESGEYQAAIKIASAEGAEVGDPSVVYIGYTYAFKPEINLYGDTQFAVDKTAKLKVAVAKASTVDIKVKLVRDEASKATAKFDSEVIIPAGETEKEFVVTVDVPDDIVPGIYPLIIKIGDVENGQVGKSASLTINLAYPFTVPITLDGLFDDWNEPSIMSFTPPEGARYPDLLEMKLTASSTYVYLYMKLYDDWAIPKPFDLFIDPDGDPETGYILTSIDNDTGGDPFADKAGGEWYVELSLHADESTPNTYQDFHSYGGTYQYDMKEDGISPFQHWVGGDDYVAPTGAELSAVGDWNDKIGQIEIQMNRKYFHMTGEKARFGIKLMHGLKNWACLGLLPQDVDGGSFKPAPMAVIYMPEYAE